ncbi:hypothetical protein [Acinetobacter gerneri]|jgi:hypothetical protein|uniref:hypothetical protein n=1 Tax=Acinetobacter gerneri TaxID=202952 RepID=UPI0023F390AC|nr:hypothetical protein [Acinetobacter gerneri]MCH4243735.1 hypothetical protein [Acinetobacter gerneri]
MDSQDLLRQLNDLVKLSDEFPEQAMEQADNFTVPEEFEPILKAVKEYVEVKYGDLYEFLANLHKDQ